MSDDRIEVYIAKELEGGLFVEFSITSIFAQSWSLAKHFYTVENGIVYEVGNGRHGATGDTALSIKASCYRLGDYDPSKTYEIKIREFTFEEMNALAAEPRPSEVETP